MQIGVINGLELLLYNRWKQFVLYRICISNCCFPNFSGKLFSVLLFSELCVLLLHNAVSTSQEVHSP